MALAPNAILAAAPAGAAELHWTPLQLAKGRLMSNYLQMTGEIKPPEVSSKVANFGSPVSQYVDPRYAYLQAPSFFAPGSAPKALADAVQTAEAKR